MRKICYVKSSRSSYRLSTLFIQYFFVYALIYCIGMDEDDTQQIESSHINTRELKFFLTIGSDGLWVDMKNLLIGR